jgi:hypothetical protein
MNTRNTRSNTLEIQEIVEQLNELQTQQSVLIERLGQLTSANIPPAEASIPSAEASEASDEPTRTITESGYERDLFPASIPVLIVGQQVRIKNPRVGQPDRGIITKITLHRITVQAANGILVARSPKNLVLLCLGQEDTSSGSSNPASDHTGYTSNSGHTNA